MGIFQSQVLTILQLDYCKVFQNNRVMEWTHGCFFSSLLLSLQKEVCYPSVVPTSNTLAVSTTLTSVRSSVQAAGEPVIRILLARLLVQGVSGKTYSSQENFQIQMKGDLPNEMFC